MLGPIPGTGFADWPITYADLEPYYTKVEWEIGVSGLAGASPFDPPRTKPYPMPPLPVKSSGVSMGAARATGGIRFRRRWRSLGTTARRSCVRCSWHGSVRGTGQGVHADRGDSRG